MTAFPPGADYETGLPVLDTPRLRLRPFTAADDPAILALFTDARSLETWIATDFRSLDDARAYRAQLAAGYGARTLFVWAVEAREAGEVIGVALLTRWAPQHRRVEMGYYLASAAWGQGYATEAAAAVRDLAFERMGVWRLEAETTPANEASKRVMRRLGFQLEARLSDRLTGPDGAEDSDLHRLLRPEWEADVSRPAA